MFIDDGTEEEFGPGDVAVIPSGHNAWVVGDEVLVGIDFTGLRKYAGGGGGGHCCLVGSHGGGGGG